MTVEELAHVLERRLDELSANFNFRLDEFKSALASHRAEQAAALVKVDARITALDEIRFKALVAFSATCMAGLMALLTMIWRQVAKGIGLN